MPKPMLTDPIASNGQPFPQKVQAPHRAGSRDPFKRRIECSHEEDDDAVIAGRDGEGYKNRSQ